MRDRNRRRDRDERSDRGDRGKRRDRPGYRTEKATKERANRQGGLYDSVLSNKLPTFKPKEGDYCIRILPNFSEDAQHYGLDVTLHYGVGADGGQYLCLNKMKGEKCPICEEYQYRKRQGDDEGAKEIRPTGRTLVWIIDRDEEDEGPKLFLMPFTFDRDIAHKSVNKRTGEVLYVDDEEDGYDIEFGRSGKGLKVKYIGPDIARKSTPLSDDADQAAEWLDYVKEHPLEECLNFYDEEYIAKVLAGGTSKDDDEDDKPRTRNDRRRSRDDDDEDDKPRSKSFRDRDEKDDEDDKSRRRRDRDDEDEDEDKPRGRRGKDEDDIDDEDEELDDDKPRRRSRDDDDEDDDRRSSKRRRDEDEDDKPRRRDKPGGRRYLAA